MKELINQYPLYIVKLCAWGSLVGINWTYGSLYEIIFKNSGFTPYEINGIGLAANVSSALFSGVGVFIYNSFSVSRNQIIKALTIAGFISTVVILIDSIFPNTFLHAVFVQVVNIMVLRAGFSAFVTLGLLEIAEVTKVPDVYSSNILFWIANLVNLLTMYLVDQMVIGVILAIMSAYVLLSLFFGNLKLPASQFAEPIQPI